MRKWWVLGILLGLMVGWVGPAAYAAPARSSKVISGRVTDLSDRAVAAALVQVVQGDGRVVGQGMTGADGQFSVSAALDSQDVFRVQVWAEGYRLGTSPWRGSWDMGELRVWLTPYGGRVKGVVTGADGVPVPGAAVEVRAAGGRLVARTTAGDAGRYELIVPPGSWQVTGEANSQPLGLKPVTVADGGVATVDLEPAALEVQIAGQVLDAVTGRPVDGARVEVHRKGFGIIASAPAVRPDGRFSVKVPAIETADLTLRVMLQGYRLVETEPFAAPAGRDVSFSGSSALQVRPLTAGIAGVLTSGNGNGLATADIWVEREGVGIVQTGRTDSAGRFRFEDLPAGDGIRYRVRTAPVGHRVTASEWLTLTGGELRPLAMVVESLNRPGAAYLVPVSVTGRVVDQRGYPIAGAEVTVMREGYNWAEKPHVTDADGLVRFQIYTETTDLSGTPPVYRVRVEKGGFFPTEDLSNTDQDLLGVGANWQAVFTVTLYPQTAQVSGRAVNPEGKPVAGAKVRLVRADDKTVATATTGVDGRYQFDAVPAAGYPAYLISAEAEGYIAAAPLPLFDVGDPKQVPDLVLHPARGMIKGRVTDPAGLPLRGIQVHAALPGAALLETVTDADGAWILADVPAGLPVSLTYSGPGYWTVKEGPAVLAGEAERAVALFPATACLGGRVAGVDGQPLAGAKVQLFQEGTGMVAMATAGKDGSYRFDQLDTLDGWYAVQVEATGYEPALPSTGLFPLLPELPGGCARRDILMAAED